MSDYEKQNRITTRAKSKEQVEKEPKEEPGTSLPPQKHDERTLALDSSPEKASTSLPKKRKLQMASPLKKERQTIQTSSDDELSTSSYTSSSSEEVPKKKKKKKSSRGCDNKSLQLGNSRTCSK
ncbi:hypothetical protein SRHO_G00250910 [Serrasalmus rhombeus]